VLEQQARLADRDHEIERLKLLIAKLRRLQFGRSSEKLEREIHQLELVLEDLEANRAGILARVQAADQHPDLRHFEVETYAWSVLPAELRQQELADGIAAELLWFANLAERGTRRQW